MYEVPCTMIFDVTRARIQFSLSPPNVSNQAEVSLAEVVCDSTSALGADDAGRKTSSNLGSDSEMVDGRDSRLIATILALEKALDQRLVDVSKEVLDRLILYDGPFGRNGALQNAHTLGILIEHRVDIIGRPKRILHMI